MERMTTEQQRIAIAETCSWPLCHISRNAMYYIPSKDIYIGNPLNDLNAMHEAEKMLSNQQKEKYLDILSDFTEGRRDTSHVWHDTVFTTAAQRAEAFLKTINLWIEDEILS